MADAIGEFFSRLGSGDREPLLGSTTATLRFDLTDGSRVDHWLVSVRRGRVTVERGGGDADCVLRADKAAFDRVASGATNAMSAALRGELRLEGDPRLLVKVQRLFPAPVGMPATSAGRSVGRRRS